MLHTGAAVACTAAAAACCTSRPPSAHPHSSMFLLQEERGSSAEEGSGSDEDDEDEDEDEDEEGSDDDGSPSACKRPRKKHKPFVAPPPRALPQRTTRGARMGNLQAEEGDEEFWVRPAVGWLGGVVGAVVGRRMCMCRAFLAFPALCPAHSTLSSYLPSPFSNKSEPEALCRGGQWTCSPPPLCIPFRLTLLMPCPPCFQPFQLSRTRSSLWKRRMTSGTRPRASRRTDLMLTLMSRCALFPALPALPFLPPPPPSASASVPLSCWGCRELCSARQ